MNKNNPRISPVDMLRRSWEPTRQRFAKAQEDHPTNLRFHRACSWLEHAENLSDKEHDVILICQWTAFNALYGRWDQAAGKPVSDEISWRDFIHLLLQLDAGGLLQSVLLENEPLVMDILDDYYLSLFYFYKPANDAERHARHTTNVLFWYKHEHWFQLLECVLEHVYIMRCHLINGVTSNNSQVYGATVKRCSMMLGHLLYAILMVWVDKGGKSGPGTICYPPIVAGRPEYTSEDEGPEFDIGT